MRLTFAAFLACSAILPMESSRCPEPRKPHLTSCTVFYNCVNLPGGGYVWVPSRCTKGLVFQPYLRMCVVPGDIWTCDTLSTDSTFVTERYETPELIDPTDTSYLGYTQDPSDFSETIDSSYAISDFVDSTTEAVTALPLIEFEDSTRENSGLRNVTYHKEENYLYEYTNSRITLPLMQKYKDIIDSHQKWLSDLITRLHIHRELSAAISASLSVEDGTTTTSPIQTVTIFASHNRKQNISVNYQNHFEANNDKPNEIDNVATMIGAVSTESTLNLLINSLDPDNNAIRITDNLGNIRFLTINEYRVAAHRLSPRTVSVVACTKNARLPNKTDCDRYYMCDPKTASVTEYSCPPHTAFNIHSRICDIESAKTCESKLSTSEIFTENIEREDAMTHSEESSEEMCKKFGKIKDSASDSHYYICYNTPGSAEVKSIRMTCPNALIFCPSKKVCTVRQLCDRYKE